ncbi:STAS-like domain-containing protein [Shewanella sp. Isolate11]|uniref:STAS-like domain-containing protein n=1 Tax=Shewanella sp. Isolate11 TaxID=2908530 RepID=UPI001EFCB356|nr:STAS-like domain-containing protein [Shewanella sp. Isolate11]MCG9697439.1 STAS-like domain-containing protein [Shewanella sp. Isolate11]
MKDITINVVTDFHPKPYGRDPEDSPGCELTCGKKFREDKLAPALKKAIADDCDVIVDLTGYNRYGRSFLDEAFGGLIRESGFSESEVTKRVKYKHDHLKTVINIIDDRIQAAINGSSK